MTITELMDTEAPGTVEIKQTDWVGDKAFFPYFHEVEDTVTTWYGLNEFKHQVNYIDDDVWELV